MESKQWKYFSQSKKQKLYGNFFLQIGVVIGDLNQVEKKQEVKNRKEEFLLRFLSAAFGDLETHWMTDQVRVTAKFKPIVEQINVSYTTSSLLDVQISRGSVIWERHYGSFVDILYHLQGSPTYQCSQLDIDCTIKAFASLTLSPNSQHLKNSSATKIFSFGPIIEQTPIGIENEQSLFYAQIQSSHGKFNKCEILFEEDYIKICPRVDLGALTQVLIGIDDLSSCYVEPPKQGQKLNSVIFPCLYQRIVCLKIFNEIVSKGTYSRNQEHLQLHICSNEVTTKLAQDELKRFLKRINNVKRLGLRRFSQSSLRMSRKPKNSMISTNIQKSMSDFPQESQDSFRFSNKKYESLKLKHCESENQIRQRPNAFSQKTQLCTLQESVNYFSEFQNLIFEEKQQQKAQVLLLSDSFEELEKNETEEKQIEKLQIIKVQKMKRKQNYSGEVEDLKIRLINLRKQKKNLMSTNTKIKEDIKNLEEGKQKDYSTVVGQAKKYLEHLKMEYRILCAKPKKSFKISHIRSQKMISKGVFL